MGDVSPHFVGGTIVFSGWATLVGVRMLRLWMRTRGLPELLLALGFLIEAVGYVALTLSGVGWRDAGDVSLWLLLPALVFCLGGISIIFVFTWRVFHPGAGWAAVLSLSGGALLIFAALGCVASFASADPGKSSWEIMQPWLTMARVVFGMGFAWGAVEGLRQYRLLRRRAAFGLADPTTTNRFLLWTLAAAGGVVLAAVGLARVLAGANTMADPISRTTTVVCGVGIILCYLLAFLPPRWYLDWVERRAAPAA